MARVSAVTVRQEPEHYVLTVRRTIDFMRDYAEFAESAMGMTRELMAEHDQLPMDGPVAWFHNTDLAALDVEVGWQIAHRVEGRDDVECRPVPSARVATAIDQGPYEEQDATLADVLAWVTQHGLAPSGPIRYRYLNDTGRPAEQYLTEMSVPVSAER